MSTWEVELCRSITTFYGRGGKILRWAGEILWWAGEILRWAGEIFKWAGEIFRRTGHISRWATDLKSEEMRVLLSHSSFQLTLDSGYVLFERHLKRVAFYWYHTRMTWQQTLSATGIHIPPIYTLPDDFDVKAWRKRVSTNAQDFCQLCEEYNVVPNLWALYEWSNWLTPVTRKIEKPPVKPKRFDTMFYMCCLDRPLEGAEACSEETTEAHVGS